MEYLRSEEVCIFNSARKHQLQNNCMRYFCPPTHAHTPAHFVYFIPLSYSWQTTSVLTGAVAAERRWSDDGRSFFFVFFLPPAQRPPRPNHHLILIPSCIKRTDVGELINKSSGDQVKSRSRSSAEYVQYALRLRRENPPPPTPNPPLVAPTLRRLPVDTPCHQQAVEREPSGPWWWWWGEGGICFHVLVPGEHEWSWELQLTWQTFVFLRYLLWVIWVTESVNWSVLDARIHQSATHSFCEWGWAMVTHDEWFVHSEMSFVAERKQVELTQRKLNWYLETCS